MTCEIITDRFEVEKLVEDIFVSDDVAVIHIDYADVCKLRQSGTFGQAIVFNVDNLNDNSIDELINAIGALQLSKDTLNAFVMNIIANEDTLSQLTFGNIMKLWDVLAKFRCSKNDSGNCTNSCTNCLLNVNGRPSLPDQTVQIHLMVTFEKTEEDKLEDVKFESLIQEYRRLKCQIADDIGQIETFDFLDKDNNMVNN